MEITDVLFSKDNMCKKYVQKTKDNFKIETTWVDHYKKYIICFSTQIGCNLGCKFCYNGIKHNYKRNLSSNEICEQIENVIKNEGMKHDKQYLFSAMGIGEPLLNYDNLVEAFLHLNEQYPDSKFALATTGVNLNGILSLTNDLRNLKDFKLTISLHTANQDKRNLLIPIKQDINELVNVVKRYQIEAQRKVEWNYVLFDGVNDSTEDAKELCELLGTNQYIKINRFNKVEISELNESKNLDKFIEELKHNNMLVEYYETNGSDINAACGQMSSD